MTGRVCNQDTAGEDGASAAPATVTPTPIPPHPVVPRRAWAATSGKLPSRAATLEASTARAAPASYTPCAPRRLSEWSPQTLTVCDTLVLDCLSARYCLAGKEQQSRPVGRKVKSGLLPEFHFHHATRVRRNEFGVGCVCHDAVGIASCASWNDGGRDLKNQ